MISADNIEKLRSLIDRSMAFALVAYPSGSVQLFESVEGNDADDHIDIYTFGKSEKKMVRLFDSEKIVSEAGASDVVASEKVQSREEYIKAVSQIIDSLALNGGKTVYSRRKLIVSPSHPADVAARYFGKHESDLCFIYYTPATGLWIGASPELIVRKDGNLFTSMALAGTKSAYDTSAWDVKNREEHNYVLDFVVDTLKDSGLTIESVVEDESVTGKVKHLRHTVTAKGESTVRDLTLRLSPTPAISGYPIETAISRIEEYEPLPRLCYGGEIIINSKQMQASYLNLRSALVSHGAQSDDWVYNLFIGGGLTAKSVASDEWDETEMKASSLADAIK